MINEDQFKSTVASNITKYRKESGLTQGALAEKLNYSDKSVSKWERGEGLPDVFVLRQMAEIFGVSVSEILGEEIKAPAKSGKHRKEKHRLIVAMSVIVVWLLAAIAFCVLIFLPVETAKWMTFIYAIPVSFIVLIVFAGIWYGNIFRAVSVSGLIWSLFLTLRLIIPGAKFNFVLLICGILQVLTILWFCTRYRSRKQKAAEKEETAKE